jgi:hypothetical protein
MFRKASVALAGGAYALFVGAAYRFEFPDRYTHPICLPHQNKATSNLESAHVMLPLRIVGVKRPAENFKTFPKPAG